MDPDASPLVRADTLASQGEQLSSRRAYQQALGAHTEAAKEYQHAAQATGDTAAAKALLLQRDIQLKLASEVQRKLERGRTTKPAVIVNVEPNARLSSATKAPGSYPSSYQDTVPLEAAESAANYRYNGSTMRNAAARNSGRTTTVIQPITTSLQHHLQNANSRINAGLVTAPRDRIDSSTLAESRYSRKSNSPTQSQISHSIPNHSGESARVGSSVEESYYLMKHDDDPADPVATFLDNVENLVEHFGNALAFASAPLHIGPPGLTTTTSTTTAPELPNTKILSSGRSRDHSDSKNIDIDPTTQMLESFYVVPTVNKPGRIAVEGISEDSEDGLAYRPNSAMLKTHEELVAENTTLKETLDHLSKRMEHMTKERKREQDTLKNSVTLFARDMRKQAERLGQSTANLAEARRQMPSAPMPGAFQTYQQHPFSQQHSTNPPPNAQIDDLHKKIASLQEESKAAKLEAEKQAANAQRYKARYDDLRKAILEKRKAKEMATAAAAATAASAATTEVSSSNGQKGNAEGAPTTATSVREGSNSLEPT